MGRLARSVFANVKKAPAASPVGHDYCQPKLEEGTDAFWQVRTKNSEYRCRLLGGASATSSGLWKWGAIAVYQHGSQPFRNQVESLSSSEIHQILANRFSGRRLSSYDSY
jgi:hypothetical protein